MGSGKKIKDDERLERMIRALLKLPENRRCINCNILGPQYVCTTFLTFICTNCSGIHREFTHRVKSISLGKFSEEEVNALQAAGNERARQIYFKTWDPQFHSFPDGSNLHKLRDFIRSVYVDRKYTGGWSDSTPSVSSLHRVNTSEFRKASVFSGRSRAPLYEDSHESSSHEGCSPAGRSGGVRYFYKETRSPRYREEISRSGSFRRSPRCIEIVDSRLRPEGSRSARRQDNYSFSPREPVARSQSFDHQSGSQMVSEVRDILGENVSTLQVGEHSNANAGKDPDDSAKSQKKAPSGGMESLIDFSMDSNPSDTVAAPNMQQDTPSRDGGNQSSDDLFSKEKSLSLPASSANSLEALLFDLEVSHEVPVDNVSAAPGTTGALSTESGQYIPSDGVSTAAPAEHQLSTAAPAEHQLSTTVTHVVNGDYQVKAQEENAFPRMQQHQLSLFLAFDNNFSAHPSTTEVETLNRQPDTSFPIQNAEQFNNVPTAQPSQATSKSATGTSYEVGLQPLSAETNSSGRKELPQDLFMESYVSSPAAFLSWQNGLPYGMGYGLQYYPTAMHAPAFPSTKKTNPFECDTTPAQAPVFPSMASFLGAFPSVQDPTALSHAPSFDAFSSAMVPHPSYIASSPMTLESPFTSTMPSSTFMGDQSHIGVPPSRLQVIGGLDGNSFTTSSSSVIQRPSGVHWPSNPPSTFPTMRTNPFG